MPLRPTHPPPPSPAGDHALAEFEVDHYYRPNGDHFYWGYHALCSCGMDIKGAQATQEDCWQQACRFWLAHWLGVGDTSDTVLELVDEIEDYSAVIAWHMGHGTG